MYALIIFDDIGFINIKFGTCKNVDDYVKFTSNDNNQYYYIISIKYLGLIKINNYVLSNNNMDITNNICTETLHDYIMSILCGNPKYIELINKDFDKWDKYYGCFKRL